MTDISGNLGEMSGKSITVRSNVLYWLIDSSGWTPRELAERVNYPGLTDKELNKTAKDVNIPLNKLEAIANTIKRPLAAFFLKVPPDEPELPKDFRKLPAGEVRPYSRETLLAIRKARRLQKIGRDLMKELHYDYPDDVCHYSLNDNPEEVARIEREKSNVSIDLQTSWKDQYLAFKEWRKWVESRNILVFQMKMPMEDARGFALIDYQPYLIVLNSSDAIRGRIFSLFHEYAHILLRESAICTTDSDASLHHDVARVEKWCNQFSGAFLLPQMQMSHDTVLMEDIESGNVTKGIKRLSNRYKISEQGALVRLKGLNYIDNHQYAEEYRRIHVEIAENLRKKKEKEQENEKKGGIPAERKCLSEKGHNFVSLVLTSSNRGLITDHDVLDYLDIKVKTLAKLRTS